MNSFQPKDRPIDLHMVSPLVVILGRTREVFNVLRISDITFGDITGVVFIKRLNRCLIRHGLASCAVDAPTFFILLFICLYSRGDRRVVALETLARIGIRKLALFNYVHA